MGETYKQADYEDQMTAESARRVLPFIIDRYRPASVVDIGCGNGVWLRELRNLGVTDIKGVDGPQSKLATEDLVVADLREGFPLFERKFDLCLCLETGEHLPAGMAEAFVDYLAALSSIIVFSAAIPGQGGHGHVNCQWQGWWVEKFRRRGYRAFDWLRIEIWTDAKVAQFYRQNIVVFEYRPDSPYSIFQDVVHPEFYTWKLQVSKVRGWGI